MTDICVEDHCEHNSLDTALFFSCRQICQEASSILYKHNTFVVVRLYAPTPSECDFRSCWLTRVRVP